MSPEIAAALQRVLDCQFQAGRALGLLEATLTAQTPKPTETTPQEKQDAE